MEARSNAAIHLGPASAGALARAFAAALGVAAVVGCGGASSPPLAPRSDGPVGKAEYERRLREDAGAGLTTEALVALADQAFSSVKARMNEIAEQLEPGSDWQTVFVRLQEQHPSDVDALLATYREEVARSARFVREHDLVTLPPNELEVVETHNPIIRQTFPLALYLNRQLGVTTSATRDPDPSYLANHCLVCIPPLAVHEGYPGHHVGFWQLERSRGAASPELAARIKAHRQNMFFLEGWGHYAEVLMLEQGYYVEPDRELGAWRAILHRALRARLDPLLHTGEMSPEEAVRLYRDELMMTEDAARTEVRRHLTHPTLKATYFVGLIQILELREQLRAHATAQGRTLDLRDFHDRLLRWPLPLPEVARLTFGEELEVPGARPMAWPWESDAPRVAW